MAYTRDSGTQNKRIRRVKKPVRMTPHSPGGQRLRPAPVSHPKPRTPAAKRQGVRVIQRAATPKQNTPYGPGGQRVHSVPVTPHKPRTKAEKKQGVKVIQKAAHVHPKKHGSGLFNFAASTLASSIPGPVGAIEKAVAPKAGKILENSAREAIDIPANIVPSTVHILGPAYRHPTSPKAYERSGKRLLDATISLPKEYIKEGKKHGLKGVEDTLVKHPLSTALTVAPIPRGPGLVAGGVARRLGKMPHIEPRVLPETAMKEAVPRSKSYFKAKRQAKKGGQVEDKHIERRVDEQVALMEDLTRRTQASTYRKAYRARKKVVSKKQARQEAATLALKEQKKTRIEQERNIYEGMALQEKPKYRASGAAKISLKEARAKEKAARKALYRFSTKGELSHTGHVQQQLLRNTGHTIADWTRLEDAETRLFTLMEHHKAEAENARALGNDALEKQHQRMADTASKQLTPIEGELEKLSRVFEDPKGIPAAAQLEANLRHSDYVNARQERQAIEANPSNLRMVRPASGKAQVFPEATQAIREAERYNSKHPIQMVPKQVKGGYVVMPKSGVKRLEQHAANTEVGPMGAMAKAYNTVWRKNVLATHPTWYAGNTIEAAIRSLASGVGPTSYVRGYKALGELKRIDPKAHAEMTGHATKGGHLAMQAHLPEETRIDITGANTLAKTARAVQGLRDKPGIRQVADGWNHITDFAMGTLSGKAESAFQTGMLGKELARNPLMDGHILKTSKAAIEDAAKGMRETHNQVALGQAIDRMYGQYGKFSPGRRKMIAHYTPFIAWTLNSLNWLYRYLPADHPVLTATAASVQPYVDQWLKDKGLSAFVHGALPSFLRGSIPTKHGFARFPTRYSPFAIAAGAPEDLAGTVLPQFKGAIDILQHQINWKGQKLKNPDGSPLDPNQLGVMAGLTLLEGMIPASQQFIGVSDRYEKGARTPRKLVKPKSRGDIGKAFNPLTTVKSPSKKSKQSNSPYSNGTNPKGSNPYSSPASGDKSPYGSP